MSTFIFQTDPFCVVEKSTVRHACAVGDDLQALRFVQLSEALLGCSFGEYKDDRGKDDRSVCPVGTVEFCRAWMHACGVIEPEPIDYPHALWQALGRPVRRMRFESADVGAWIKPTRTKDWAAHIKQPGEQPSGPGLVWASPAIHEHDWFAEWRIYVLRGKIVGHGRYDDGDDEDAAFDAALVQTWVDAYTASGQAPAGYALDVASMMDGRTMLVEVTDGWALGYYKGSCSAVDYARLLAARWAEIVRQSATALRHAAANDWPRDQPMLHAPLLHLYAQCTNHDDAHIVGTRTGLMLLRDAIDRALAHGSSGEARGVFASDGEGYDVRVACAQEHAMDMLRRPYIIGDGSVDDGAGPSVFF